MRWILLLVASLVLVMSGCRQVEDAASAQRALSDQPMQGEVDKAIEGAEPPPGNRQGPPLPAPPPDPAYEAKRAAFRNAAIQQLTHWRNQGLSPEEIQERYTRLKQDRLPPQPPPPPNTVQIELP